MTTATSARDQVVHLVCIDIVLLSIFNLILQSTLLQGAPVQDRLDIFDTNDRGIKSHYSHI